MSWKLIFGLSIVGLVMGLSPIFLIPRQIEPHLWLAIACMSALVIAKRAPSRYFLHGLCVSVLGSLWVTAAHFALFQHNAVIHGRVLALSVRAETPQLMMAVGVPLVGIAGGLILGAVAWVASKFVVSAHSEFAGW